VQHQNGVYLRRSAANGDSLAWRARWRRDLALRQQAAAGEGVGLWSRQGKKHPMDAWRTGGIWKRHSGGGGRQRGMAAGRGLYNCLQHAPAPVCVAEHL